MLQLSNEANRGSEIGRDRFTGEGVTSHVENRADKQQRGICVRKACRDKATDGDYCDRHAGLQRAYHRLYMRRQREQWNTEGRCTRCGGKRAADSKWCAGCQIRTGKVPRKDVKKHVENHGKRVAEGIRVGATKGNEGRRRFHGSGKRGRRSVADDDRERILSMRRFLEKLDEGQAYAASDAVKTMGAIQREDATHAAMGWALLIRRTCDEMLRANKYPIPEQIDDSDDED